MNINKEIEKKVSFNCQSRACISNCYFSGQLLCHIPYGLNKLKSSNVNRTASDQGLYPFEFNTGIAMEYGNNDIS